MGTRLQEHLIYHHPAEHPDKFVIKVWLHEMIDSDGNVIRYEKKIVDGKEVLFARGDGELTLVKNGELLAIVNSLEEAKALVPKESKLVQLWNYNYWEEKVSSKSEDVELWRLID